MSSVIGSSCCLPTRHLNSRRFQVDTTCRKLAAPVPTAPSCLPLPVVLHDSESFWFIWEISLKLWWIWYEIFRYLAHIGFIKSKGCSVYAKVGFCQHKCKDSDVQFSWLPPRKWWHNWIYTFGHLIPACACHPMFCSNISSYIVLSCKSSILLSHHTQEPKTKKNPEKKKRCCHVLLPFSFCLAHSAIDDTSWDLPGLVEKYDLTLGSWHRWVYHYIYVYVWESKFSTSSKLCVLPQSAWTIWIGAPSTSISAYENQLPETVSAFPLRSLGYLPTLIFPSLLLSFCLWMKMESESWCNHLATLQFQ